MQHGLHQPGPHLHLLRPAARPARRACSASPNWWPGKNGNIIRLEHNQFVNLNRQSGVELKVTLEAFGHAHKQEIMDALAAAGYDVREVMPSSLYN